MQFAIYSDQSLYLSNNGGVVHSVIASPLVVGKNLMGVIGIARTQSTEIFTGKDQNLLLLFGQQAAIAIKNAELFSKVQALTKIDSLTGAYNRRGFNELCYRELLRAKRTNQPQSMLMIDLDFFKKINDQHGHPIGDQMLIMLSNELRDHLRETDIMCRCLIQNGIPQPAGVRLCFETSRNIQLLQACLIRPTFKQLGISWGNHGP